MVYEKETESFYYYIELEDLFELDIDVSVLNITTDKENPTEGIWLSDGSRARPFLLEGIVLDDNREAIGVLYKCSVDRTVYDRYLYVNY